MKRFWFCLVLFLPAAILPSTRAEEKEKEKHPVLFAESFDGRLAAGWSWVREDPKAWKIDKGALSIRTSTGGLWQKDNNNQNMLLRKPPHVKESGLIVEVLVENEPTNAFEHAGLVWYQDDDNYVCLLKEKVGAKQVVQLVLEKESRPKVGFAEKPYEGKSVWLRMEVRDGKIRGRYRATQKEDWRPLGQCDIPFRGEARIGLMAGYAAKNSEHRSLFGRFRILQAAKETKGADKKQ